MPEIVEQPLKTEIRLLQESDLPKVGEIYARAFEKANIGEQWTPKSAEKFMRYWFNRQSDLFLIAESEGKVVGGIVAGIKPWWNGNHMVDGELFVDPEIQKKRDC